MGSHAPYKIYNNTFSFILVISTRINIVNQSITFNNNNMMNNATFMQSNKRHK